MENNIDTDPKEKTLKELLATWSLQKNTAVNAINSATSLPWNPRNTVFTSPDWISLEAVIPGTQRW